MQAQSPLRELVPAWWPVSCSGSWSSTVGRVRVLVIGGGAREHALVRTLRRDPEVTSLVCAPGNAGIAADVEVRAVDALDGGAVADLAEQLGTDLVVVGPEAPLVAGVADAVRRRGVACFGPSAAAARLEGSKAFAKDVMESGQVPTGRSLTCRDQEEFWQALEEFGAPYVVKDDGLAAGKGVVVTEDREAAWAHAVGCEQVLVEEFLDGPEVSLFALADGHTVLPLQPAQDFKRAGDGDTGPNTGGMGAYSPLPWAEETLVDEVCRTVLQPTVDEMRRRGAPFVGLLYAGLALTSRGVRVIEFNARFGDPETQVVLARLRTPLGGLLHAAATGRLADMEPPEWSADAAVTVVIAAEGYPGAPRTGDPVGGLEAVEAEGEAYVLHGGTRYGPDGRVVSAGGRVLSVTATGGALPDARQAVYRAVGQIELTGAQHRGDICRF